MCMRRYSIRPTKPLGTASPDTPTPAPNPPDDDDGPAEPRSPVLPRRWVRPPSRHVSSPTTTTNNNVASFRFRSAFITPTYTSPILTRRSRPLGKHLPGTSASPGGLQRRLARSQRRRRMPLVSTAPVSARATPIEVPTFHVIHRPKDDEEEQQKQQQQQQSSPQPPPGSPRAASAEEPPEHPPRPHSIIAVPAQPLLLPHDTEGEVLVLPACDYDDIYQRHVSSNTSMVCMQFGRLPDGPPLPLLPQATSAHMCIPLPHVPSSNFFLPTTSVCRSSLSSRDRFSSWFADVKSPLGPIPSFSDASTTAMLLASSVTASFAASLASEPVPLTNNNNSNTRRRPSSGTPVPLPPSMPRPSISASSSSPPTSSAAAATGKSAAANAPEVNSMATMMMRNHNTNTNIAATINTSPPPPPHRVDPPTVPQDEEDDCVSHHHHHTVRATPTPPPARVESRGGDGLCPAVQQISLLSPLSTISPPRPGPATATRPSSTSLGPSLKQVQGAPFQLALFDDCSTEGSNNSSITSPIRVSPPRGELSMRRSLKVVHDGQLIVSFDADLSNTNNNNNNKEELLPLNRREGSEGSTDPDVRPSSQQRQFFEWVKQRLVPQREVNARSSGSLDSAMMEMPIRLCHKKSASASDVGSFAT